MLIDSHAHLDMKEFEEDRPSVVERAVEGGLSHILTVGTDQASSREAVAITRQYNQVYAAVGYHPHDAQACTEERLGALATMAEDPKVVAWGEIGLDFYRLRSPRGQQTDVFSRQLRIAHDLGLPVIVHDREAHQEVYSELKDMGKGRRKGVIHCFSGDIDLAAAFIELGYAISIPGTVTYKKANLVKEVAASIPLEHMLVETDCPFLAPVPRRGKRNEPLLVSYTAHEIARLRGIPFEEVAAHTTQNAKVLFGLP